MIYNYKHGIKQQPAPTNDKQDKIAQLKAALTPQTVGNGTIEANNPQNGSGHMKIVNVNNTGINANTSITTFQSRAASNSSSASISTVNTTSAGGTSGIIRDPFASTNNDASGQMGIKSTSTPQSGIVSNPFWIGESPESKYVISLYIWKQ